MDGLRGVCLAGADLARDLDEALTLLDAEGQVIEGLFVALAVEEEARVGRDVEGRLAEAVELVVPAFWRPGGRTFSRGRSGRTVDCSEGSR